MALFGSSRDVSTFKGIAKELLENVISQQVGYYKYMLGDTAKNVYGEATARYYIGPVLINCLIERGEFNAARKESLGPDVNRDATFRFLKDHLQDANVVPEIGDVYDGVVKGIKEFGAFVEFMPGKQGLLHISEISWKRLETMDGIYKEGDQVKVKLVGLDPKTGKFKLSHKALLPKPEQAPREDRPQA